MAKTYTAKASDIHIDASEAVRGDERALIRSALGLSEDCGITILRRSLDSRFHRSRGIFYVYTVRIVSPRPLSGKHFSKDTGDEDYPPVPAALPGRKAYIAGTGPAGLFAALRLTEAGIRPVLIERGKDIPERKKDIERLETIGILDGDSNVQFGLGGAGTYSDGKLNTRIHSPGIRKVLSEFVRFGADPSVMYDARPHVGTDRLSVIISSIKRYLEENGAEFLFSSKLTDIFIKDGKLTGIEINGRDRIDCSELILAVGNAARDTFEMLYRRGIFIEQKAIAVGVRIEHPQILMDKRTYGTADRGVLPPAEFSFTFKDDSGRGVYTFCNCPGGYVVNSSTEDGMLAINGMSMSGRRGETSNSALVVTVKKEDYPDESPLAGIDFQRTIEKNCYSLAGGDYKVPSMGIGRFIGEPVPGHIPSTVKPGSTESDLGSILPESIASPLRSALKYLSTKTEGFSEGVMTAPETRTSSPVRLTRNTESGESISTKGLFPAGEGAGYAGGIVSSAVDGMNAADRLIEYMLRE